MIYEIVKKNMMNCDVCCQEKEINNKGLFLFCDNCKKRICDKCYNRGYHGEQCRLKKCKKCNQVKQLNEFCRHSISNDGHYNYCKKCVKTINRERYIKRIQIYKMPLEPIEEDNYHDDIKYEDE